MSKFKNFGRSATAFTKKHGPQILIIAGIVGNAVATVMACKQTLTAKNIINDHKERRDEVEDAKEICRREIKIYDIATGKDDKHVTNQAPCSEEDYNKYCEYLDKGSKKEILKVYALTGFKFIRHYALPIALIVGSTSAIGAGTGMLTKKVNRLTGSLATLSAVFSGYRERVKEAIGEEAENRIFTNEQVKTRKYKDVDDDGNEVEKEETIITTDGRYDPYAIKLDRNSWLYAENIRDTLVNIKRAQQRLTEQLIGKGDLILNEVYDYIGPYKKTEDGAIVGWKHSHDPFEQEQYGDGYVSFGIFSNVDKDSGYISKEPLYLNDQWESILASHESIGQNKTDDYDIWLHFNVDGPIIQNLSKRPGLPA